MKDRYLDFVNSPFGTSIARSLGLPRPETLRRQRADQAEFGGMAAIGAGPSPALFDDLMGTLSAIGMTSIAHESASGWLPVAARHGAMSGRFEPRTHDAAAHDRVQALIFDATGIDDAGQLHSLYAFFHDALRSLGKNGRIVVLGRPPATRASVAASTAQYALDGMTRSLGKEARNGITANLLRVTEGADIDSALRFFLSPRSAYVSGQSVSIDYPAVAPESWATPLAGKRALVTGAARGIGASIASVLAAHGAIVTGLDVAAARDALDQTMLSIEDSAPSGGAHAALVADIGAPEAPVEIAAALLASGGIDIVVHNAGITRDKTIARMSGEMWDSVIDINLLAQARIDEVLLAENVLRAGGRIVAVSSISGIAGNRGQTNYATSKSGVIGRVHAMAPALRERGITINAVAPGFIETHMTARMPFGVREAGRRLNSLGQGGLPVDVAETVAWLASPGSAGITGNVVRVCGQSLIGA
ncbi:3-oxoacyl-ACP reductase [Caballeronia insecticola]|uniref:Putative 3-oxoacyl-(Acyl-carrier-protein) reductase transmembrane protein n=1 Tax=Caballeronia insecticola TaxID=758793 RepID=R4WH53_9BURK|nr:3-oxoacyl-ACP reductase [Caballeronia insecticola]BAN23408.1 putative 3-oxoacyl-(Acyl-carrier-protein) reductase transmembrane protein [Caballeronia insecticola]